MMKNKPAAANEKALRHKQRTHALVAEGGLVRVAKRVLASKGITPPDAPMLVGIIIEGTERMRSLSQERAQALRNLGFLAMRKQPRMGGNDGTKNDDKRPVRNKYFYHRDTVDPNLNL